MLFNLGPGRLGTLSESIAIPEIRQQAIEIAAVLAWRLRKYTAVSPAQLLPAKRSPSWVAV